MLINLSNHPSANWSEEQKNAAEQQFGQIVDIPFPQVDPYASEEVIAAMADEYCQLVLETVSGQSTIAVHLMGEMTLTFALLQRLQSQGISCVASTTMRETIEFPDGRKESVFKFVKFRKYIQVLWKIKLIYRLLRANRRC